MCILNQMRVVIFLRSFQFNSAVSDIPHSFLTQFSATRYNCPVIWC